MCMAASVNKDESQQQMWLQGLMTHLCVIMSASEAVKVSQSVFVCVTHFILKKTIAINQQTETRCCAVCNLCVQEELMIYQVSHQTHTVSRTVQTHVIIDWCLLKRCTGLALEYVYMLYVHLNTLRYFYWNVSVVGEHGQHRLHRLEGRHTCTWRCGRKPELLGSEGSSVPVALCLCSL